MKISSFLIYTNYLRVQGRYTLTGFFKDAENIIFKEHQRKHTKFYITEIQNLLKTDYLEECTNNASL